MKAIDEIKEKHLTLKELSDTAEKVRGEMLDKINRIFDLLFCGGIRIQDQDSTSGESTGLRFGDYIRATRDDLNGSIDLNLTSVFIQKHDIREIIWDYNDILTIMGNGEASEGCESLSDILVDFLTAHGFTVRSSVTGWVCAEDAAKVKKALERVANYDKALEEPIEEEKNMEEKMSKERMVKIEMDINTMTLEEATLVENFMAIAREAAYNVLSLRDAGTKVCSTLNVGGKSAKVTVDPVPLNEYALKFDSDEIDDIYVEAESLEEAVRMFEQTSSEIRFKIEENGEEVKDGELDLTENFRDVVY